MKPAFKGFLLGASLAVLGDLPHAHSAANIVPVKTEVPAGAYTLDKAHASITFKVNHIGFSNYTAHFSNFDATLKLHPKEPSASKITATVDVRSLVLNTPPTGFLEQVLGREFFEADKFPTMKFVSTRVVMTAPNTADITGNLTLHGVTKPVVLHAVFNGGWAGFEMDPHARAGFSASGFIKRSEFGMTNGLPPPGTSMGVGDRVDIAIETEFTGPAWHKPAAPKEKKR
ncbi:MAG: polyisoprenoid-binding protein [Alphaproteobacteria bacterium]|nr:polyisoprenoid-binding protein [Alphaproteobacteria bacterium]